MKFSGNHFLHYKAYYNQKLSFDTFCSLEFGITLVLPPQDFSNGTTFLLFFKCKNISKFFKMMLQDHRFGNQAFEYYGEDFAKSKDYNRRRSTISEM